MAFPPQKTRTVDSHVRRVHPPPPPLDPVAVGARWMRCWGPSRAAAFAITRHHRSNLRTNPTCTPKPKGAQEAMAAGFLLAVRPLVLTSNTISLLLRWQKLFFDHDGRIPRSGATSLLIAYPDPHASQRERC